MIYRLLFAATLFIAILNIATPAHALSVDAVRFGKHPDKTRIVIDLDQSSDFKAFVLSNPNRLVIDLPAYSWNAGHVTKPKGANVTDLRTGALNQSVSRLVVDVNSPIAIKSAFTLPSSGKNKFRLVIDFQKTSAPSVPAETKKQFGTLAYKEVTATAAKTNFNAKVVTPSQSNISNIPSNASTTVTPKRKPQAASPRISTQKTTANIKSFLRKPYICRSFPVVFLILAQPQE